MKKPLHKRLGFLALTGATAWLMWAAPVAWTACTAMSVHMLTTECQPRMESGEQAQSMREGCLLQLGGISNYLAVPTTSVLMSAPAALPPAPLESLLRNPQVSVLAPFIDVSPPLRPRPLRFYYAVFLK